MGNSTVLKRHTPGRALVRAGEHSIVRLSCRDWILCQVSVCGRILLLAGGTVMGQPRKALRESPNHLQTLVTVEDPIGSYDRYILGQSLGDYLAIERVDMVKRQIEHAIGMAGGVRQNPQP